MNFKVRKVLLSVLVSAIVAVSLAGCGGGGGGGGDVNPVQSASTFPLSTSIVNWINNTKSYQVSMSGTANSSTVHGETFTGVGTMSESTTTSSFEGVQALIKSTSVTATLQVLGQNIPFADTSATYFDSNYKPLGSTAVSV